ncbi:MAG: hypothetical protein WBB18_03555 [Nodosilinea sp.]
MTNESTQPDQVGNPKEAEPGRGAPGGQWAVQTAQPTDVNPPDEKIPSGVDEAKNRQQIEDYAAQEEGTLPTSHGFVLDEAGKIDNFAVEPPMYVEE